MMNIHFDRVHFGFALSGAVLKFRITPREGFAVRAVLDRDAIVIGRWEFEEVMDGATFEEPLIPTGTYTLTLHVAFTDENEATLDVSFELNGTRLACQLTGRTPDIGRALAVVFIE